MRGASVLAVPTHEQLAHGRFLRSAHGLTALAVRLGLKAKGPSSCWENMRSWKIRWAYAHMQLTFDKEKTPSSECFGASLHISLSLLLNLALRVSSFVSTPSECSTRLYCLAGTLPPPPPLIVHRSNTSPWRDSANDVVPCVCGGTKMLGGPFG